MYFESFGCWEQHNSFLLFSSVYMLALPFLCCVCEFATKTTSQSKSRGTLAARFEYHNFHAKPNFCKLIKLSIFNETVKKSKNKYFKQ